MTKSSFKYGKVYILCEGAGTEATKHPVALKCEGDSIHTCSVCQKTVIAKNGNLLAHGTPFKG